MNETQLSKEMHDWKVDVIEVFREKYGARLTIRAADHIDAAKARSGGSWEKIYSVLEEKQGEGRSHALALQMFSIYVQVLSEEVLPKWIRRAKRHTSRAAIKV